MTKRPRDQSVGPWAKEKLESLRAYLDYYTRRLKNQAWCQGRWFIDAFAGPGMSPIRTKKADDNGAKGLLLEGLLEEDTEPESVEYVKGSPRVALELSNPFDRYVFIDDDPERVAELQALKAEFSGRRDVEVLPGDANQRLQQILAMGINWRVNKGVVFLDPFGMQAPWATIEALAKTGGLEVIINFPFAMAINRLLLRSGEIPKAWQQRLDLTFGSPDWRQLVYEEHTDLLGTVQTKRRDATERILDWFSSRLRTAFGHASKAQLIRNTKGNPLYYLIWAGPHKAGLTGADYILGRKKPVTDG